MIRGAVQDRPWGRTLGALARRGVTGQLTVRNHNARFQIAFHGGHVVAATSPGKAETPITLAIRQHLITSAQLVEIDAQRVGADDDHLLATIGELSAEQILRLRRQSLAAAVARTFVFEHGEWTLDNEITIPIAANTATHVGGLIYHGSRAYLGEHRLQAAVHELGARFELRDDTALDYFPFGSAEQSAIDALREGTSISALDAITNETERRIARSVVYALGSCGVLHCEAPRFARGTTVPMWQTPAPVLRESRPKLLRTYERRASTPPP